MIARTTIPVCCETLIAARVALRDSIKQALPRRHSMPKAWRAVIRQNIAALRDLDRLRGEIDRLPTIKRR